MSENERKVVIKFIGYLESDKEKYTTNYKHKMTPYSYSKEVNEFIGFYFDSSLLLKYESVEERKQLQIKVVDKMTYNELRKYLYALFIGERFSSGIIRSSIKKNKLLNVLKKLILYD